MQLDHPRNHLLLRLRLLPLYAKFSPQSEELLLDDCVETHPPDLHRGEGTLKVLRISWLGGVKRSNSFLSSMYLASRARLSVRKNRQLF